MFTFSFSSAFAALQYEGTTTTEKPVAEKTDFTGVGTFGISTVEQQSETIGLEEEKDGEAGKYPADLQAKVDAAYDTAIAAVKAAKTAKEMNAAKTTLRTTLEKLALSGKSYDELYAKATFFTNAIAFFDLDDGHYVIPDCGLITVKEGKIDDADEAQIVFNWLMDQGYYGYVDDAAWEKVLTTDKTVKNAVAAWLETYYIGEITLEQVYQGDKKASELEKYGRTVYAEYADAVVTFEEYNSELKKTTTIDEFVAVVDKLNAFADKYGFDGTVAINPAVSASYEIKNDNKLLVAIDKWYISNLEDAVEAIEKINTAAGYTAAKADIIAATKKVLEVEDKYDDLDYFGLATEMLYGKKVTIVNALKKVMQEDATSLDKVCKDTAYTENITDDKKEGYADFDSSEANLAAIAAARAAFDAYVADYTFAYEAERNRVDGIATIENLVGYEVKLLAAEYNKTAVPETADKETAEKNAKVQAWLDNATVKVTTQALGNRKIRVQAKIDADSFEVLSGYTIEYKFYKKTAKAASYKGYSDRAVNYTTFVKLTKGTKYNFKCAVTVKDKDGNVVATKGYLGSTTGIRTAK